jgi:hypothetical protein
MMFRLAILSFLVIGSNAFMTVPATPVRTVSLTKKSLLHILQKLVTTFNLILFPLHRSLLRRQSNVARNLIMTEEEISAILDKAHACVESECAVDDVDMLIAELKDQQKVLNTRLENIMNVVAHLQHANEQKERKREDVRAIVKDMLRVFTSSNGKFAIGFKGDIGDGPTTAYDALPPKPWKGAP